MEYYEIKQKKKKAKKAKAKPVPKAKAKARVQPLPRSVKALLSYLGKSDTAVSQSSGGRIPQRIQPTEQSITINLAGLERVSAPPAQDVLRSFIAGTKERTGANIQSAFQQQTYDQVSQLKKQLEEAEREQKKYEGRLKQGEDVLGQLQSSTTNKGITQRQLQQTEAQLRQELAQVKRQVLSNERQVVDTASSQYRQVRESMGRFYKSQGYTLAGQAFADADPFDNAVEAQLDIVPSGQGGQSYSSLSRPDSYVAPSFAGGLARSSGSSAPPAPAPRKMIKVKVKKAKGGSSATASAIREKGQAVAEAVAGGGEAQVGLAFGSPMPETPTSKALKARLAELTGTSKSKVKLGIKGRGAGAKYASISSDVEELQKSGLSGGALLSAIKQKYGANISFM
jgi:hypothetical protein